MRQTLQTSSVRTVVGRFRWRIGALIVFANTINYIDRQVLGLLAPDLEKQFGWSEIEYGYIVTAFQGAFALGYLFFGWFIDRYGTKLGYAVALALWSLAAAGHGWARTVGQFGGKLTRFQTEADMDGDGATALLNGVFFPIAGQQHGNYTLQHHKATHCTSDLLYKGALLGGSRSVYEGAIKVAKGAQQTDAYQANRNLMLSRNAHADSIPQLEIEANDVRCTHGSTTSQMDQEELFYMQSRGIGKDAATKLIVEGFFVPVLDRIPLREVRRRLQDAIQAKMSY